MICVDELREIKDDSVPITSIDNKMKGCNLYSDSNDVNALHFFAFKIGVSRNFYKSDSFLSRYVLNENQRALAVLKGAKEVSFRQTVLTVRSNKEKSMSSSQRTRRENEK
jgi:hypothetical protein